MARFVATPEVQTEGQEEGLTILLASIKENIELMAGTRGEADLASRVVTRGDVAVQETDAITARGEGYLISGQKVASLDDVGLLINDVARLRDTLNTLIRNLKGA